MGDTIKEFIEVDRWVDLDLGVRVSCFGLEGGNKLSLTGNTHSESIFFLKERGLQSFSDTCSMVYKFIFGTLNEVVY